MLAMRVHSYDPGASVECNELPIPEPLAGQVRVRVHACGISFVDLLVARGGYQVKPSLPFVPGSEFSGTVDALGPDVTSTLKVGDRVCGTRQGAWAQFICCAVDAVQVLSPDASVEETAVLTASYGTALYALRERGRLRAGETLLVLGATGGVGHAAVQLGKLLGARVVAMASTAAKRAAACAAGADETVDSANGDWKDAVKALVPGGVDVVFDTVGGDATDAAFRTLGWGGRHLMVGFAGGQIGMLKTNLSIVKGASLIGVDFRQSSERDGDLANEIKREVVTLYQQGRIRPLVSHVLPVQRFAEAAAMVGDRAGFGRVVITL
ncbi:MAG: NADPH:quinone oxidoreductase family protein [Sulfuricaulis sp.]|nr:NADPH:quinone oxidoreductase family protein [Sulfuricaulis sp.]